MMNKGFASTLSVAEATQMAKNYLHVGYDNGNLHNRVVTDGLAAMDQSYVLTVEEGEGLSKAFKCVKDGSASSRWTGKRFLVGNDALAIDGDMGDRTMDCEENKYRLALPLLVSALWSKIKPDNSTVIRLGVTVPNPAVVEDEIVNHLHGVGFEFKQGETMKRFDIVVEKVYTEGQGVIKRQSDISKGIFQVDLGNDTIILSEFQGYSLKSSFPLTSKGVRALGQELIASPELSKAIGRTADLNDVVEMFEQSDGAGFTLYKQDVSEIVNKYAKEWIGQCVKSAKRNMKNAFDNSPTKIATGGGCKINVVRDYLTKEGFKIAGDPLWDNAAGVYQFVCKKHGHAEKMPSFKVKATKKAAKASEGN